MEIDPHPPEPPTLTTIEQVQSRFDEVAPFLWCQACGEIGTFTPPKKGSKKLSFICRALDGNCSGRLSPEAILYMATEGKLSASPRLGVATSTLLQAGGKRSREASQSPERIRGSQNSSPSVLPSKPIDKNKSEILDSVQGVAFALNALNAKRSDQSSNTFHFENRSLKVRLSQIETLRELSHLSHFGKSLIDHSDSPPI
jgi:hypothetical protein